MKKIHVFIIKSYLGPFFLTFLIALFVLLMQFLWKYLEDLVGKGLEWSVVMEVMLYASASLIPMALPLAILLASIMTFGNLGEHYELVSMKSAGMSLPRIMYPLIMLTIITSVVAFYFSNNVLPVANLKFGRLIYDITNQKPTINIPEGIFYNGIEKMTMRVSKKENDGNLLKGIIIYDHTSGQGNNKVITAESGTMTVSPKKDFMIMELFNGYSYEEQLPDPGQRRSNIMIRSKFEEQVVRIDLSEFNLSKSSEDLFKDHYQMMNLTQLQTTLDTLHMENKERRDKFNENFSRNFQYFRDHLDTSQNKKPIPQLDTIQAKYLKDLPTREKTYQVAANLARSAKLHLESQIDEDYHRRKFINRHSIEWHRKFTLSFACLVLFFIGAPLGAIIRKGGLGMPVVVSVVFFLVFHVISITGEKFVKEGVSDPFSGMWMASFVFLPLGIFLTFKASRDSVIFDMEFYTSLFGFIKKKKKKVQLPPDTNKAP